MTLVCDVAGFELRIAHKELLTMDLTRLPTLKIFFHTLSNITDYNHTLAILKRFQNLTTLVLTFGSCTFYDAKRLCIKNTKFEQILKSIGRMRKLQALHIQILENDFTDSDMLMLSRFLSKMKQLTSLKFSLLYGMKLSPSTINFFIERLKINLPHLKCLDLNLQRYYLSKHEYLPSIASGLFETIRAMKKLRSLRLNLARWNAAITCETAADLARVIEELKELEELSLCFNDCRKIEDEGLQLVAQGISKRMNLKKLGLYLKHNKRITKESWQNLLQVVSGISGLNKTELVFSDFCM